MGVLISRFRRKKTTIEILESLENRIKSVEENRLHTEQKQRKIVGHLILYSVGVYVIAAVSFYFLYFPASLQDQLFYITPLLIFPIIVVFVKRLVTWYYRRKLTRNQEKLHDMKEEKKRLLDDVMEKETYKVAKEILEKFAPDQLQKSPTVGIPAKFSGSPDLSVHRRATIASLNTSTPRKSSPPIMSTAGSIAIHSPGTDVRRRSPLRPPGPVQPPVLRDAAVYLTSGQTNGQGIVQRPALPMPRPVLPRDRSYLDKLVEYLVGDGPSNRYALICKNCDSHNGMALKEEFEYFAFRCCYCFYWNPARKQRPQAPRLPSTTGRSELFEHTSASELESATDTEEESDSEQSSDSEPITEEGGTKIAEVDGATDLAQISEPGEAQISEPGEPQSTEGEACDKSLKIKPSSSDMEDTEATKLSDS